jgi:hypothetical protein
MHLQVCGGGEKGGNTRARSLASPRWAGGGVGRWARAHDVCVNSPLKFGSKPRMPTTSFCRLFLL